jgi:GT2 family glycosyltransferase
VQPAPLVTVVTPCLDPGPALDACLASVRGQSYPAIEHVVVDAASTDGTVDRLRAAEGVRWVSEPDDGQAQALNKGFALARGELLTWLCADDELLPDAVARAVGALQASGAEWVYGDCEIADPRHPELRRPRTELSPEIFVLGNPIAQPGTFFTAAALARVGPLDESLDLAFDYDLWLRLAAAGVQAVYVPETLARFHVSATSKTGRHGRAPFLREEAIALAKTRPGREAALRLGTSAALDAEAGGVVTRRRLAAELAARGPLVGPQDRAVLRAAGLTEATFLELPRLRGLRHLLALEPWRTPETRRVVLARTRSRLRRGARRAA